jgi:peptide/nickel transport system permease protein
MRVALYYLSLVFLLAVAVASLAAKMGTVTDTDLVQPEVQFQYPDRQYLLGTDQFGRDNFSRLLLGSSTTLGSALVAALIALVFGTISGAVAGAGSPMVDSIIMRVMDVLLSLPGFMVALVFVAVFGTGGWVAVIGVGVSLTPGLSRFVRGSVLSLRTLSFVEASRALGASRLRIIAHHLVPNVMNPILAFSGVIFAWSLMALASLEFLGLVGSPSDPGWGRMLADGRMYLRSTPWIALPPGIVIAAIVLAILRVSDHWRSH